MDDLDVIIRKTDGAERQRGAHHQPNKGVRQIGPEQRGQQNRNADEDSAHGGRAGLLLVILRAVFADVLADLELAQLLDHIGTDEQRDHERSERGKGGAKRQIPEDAEGSEVREKLLIKEPVKQTSSGQGAVF